ERVVLARQADASAGARQGHEVDVVIGLRRVVAAVVAPVTKQSALSFGPAHGPLVGGQADEGAFLGPLRAAKVQCGRDVVVAVEVHRDRILELLGRVQGGLYGLLLTGGFRAIVTARGDNQLALDRPTELVALVGDGGGIGRDLGRGPNVAEPVWVKV